MTRVLLVGAGGFLGSAARYLLSTFAFSVTPNWRFPLGTFLENILGCFAVGLLAGLAEGRGYFSPETRILLVTGLLGGFTTFSAFGLETLVLIKRGNVWIAALYIAASVVLGLLGAWGGELASVKYGG